MSAWWLYSSKGLFRRGIHYCLEAKFSLLLYLIVLHTASSSYLCILCFLHSFVSSVGDTVTRTSKIFVICSFKPKTYDGLSSLPLFHKTRVWVQGKNPSWKHILESVNSSKQAKVRKKVQQDIDLLGIRKTKSLVDLGIKEHHTQLR